LTSKLPSIIYNQQNNVSPTKTSRAHFHRSFDLANLEQLGDGEGWDGRDGRGG
jgi:hypothetical protein